MQSHAEGCLARHRAVGTTPPDGLRPASLHLLPQARADKERVSARANHSPSLTTSTRPYRASTPCPVRLTRLCSIRPLMTDSGSGVSQTASSDARVQPPE